MSEGHIEWMIIGISKKERGGKKERKEKESHFIYFIFTGFYIWILVYLEALSDEKIHSLVTHILNRS